MDDHERHLRAACRLALENVDEGGSPYGAVIVRDGDVIAASANTIHRTNDPTDHAEMVAIRQASRALGRKDLSGCVMYASGQPCPMCHAAMRLSGFREGYFAYSAEEAESHGLISAGIYAELCKPLDVQPMRLRHLRPTDEITPLTAWQNRKATG